VVDAIVDGVTGLLVPPDDPIELADALTSLLTDRERAESLGRGARERVLREATWSHAADAIFAAMQRALHGD